MIAMYSRVRAKGFPNGTPCQPSTTCGPDGPMPHRKRLPERACKVIAVIAAQVGGRGSKGDGKLHRRILSIDIPIRDRGPEPAPGREQGARTRAGRPRSNYNR